MANRKSLHVAMKIQCTQEGNEYMQKQMATFTQMFTAALFTVAKTLTHTRHPSIGEGINKLQYIHGTLINTKKKWAMKLWQGRKETSSVKEINLKRLQTVWYQLQIFWKRHHYEDIKKISSCQGSRGKDRWTGEAQRIFRAEKLLCMTL